MAYVSPQSQPAPTGGLLFVNPPGVDNYRPLRVDVGDQHLFWQSTYQHLLRVEGAFGEFFPQADFADNGNRVVFTKHVEGVEVLARSRPLRAGERIPRAEWVRFLETWKAFKRLGERTDIPEDNRAFIQKFSPPALERYPQAYRIYRPHWYSRPRLFILWGLEPVGGGDFTTTSPEEVITAVGRNVESAGQERDSAFFRWLKIALVALLAFALLLLLVWALLPRPIVDFEVEAEAGRPAKVRNHTQLDAIVVYGTTTYDWRFDQGTPTASVEFEPGVVWASPAAREVSLSATQETLWGLLYKTATLSKTVQVAEPPKPVTPIKEDPVKPGEQTRRVPVTEGSDTVDKPRPLPGKSADEGASTPNEAGKTPGKMRLGPDGRPLSDDAARTLDDKGDPAQPLPGRAMQGQAGKPLPEEVPPQPKMGTDGKPVPPKVGGDGVPLIPKEDVPPAKAKEEGGPAMSKEEGKHLPEGIPAQPKMGTDGKPLPPKDGEQGVPLNPKEEMPPAKSKDEGGPAMSKEEGKPSPGEPEGEPKVFRLKPIPGDPSKQGATPAPAEKSPGGPPMDPAKESTNPRAAITPTDPKGGKGASPVEPDPTQAPRLRQPKARSDGKARALPMPELEISDAQVVEGGKAQDIDFRLRLPAKIQVERLTIDGKDVGNVSSGVFRARLGLGRHDIHVEYRATDGEVREDMLQEMLVDQEEIKTFRPKPQLGPKVKLPALPPPPSEAKPVKDEDSEINKRIA